MEKLLEERNFFTGTNPAAIVSVLKAAGEAAPDDEGTLPLNIAKDSIDMHNPWKWVRYRQGSLNLLGEPAPESSEAIVFAVSWKRK